MIEVTESAAWWTQDDPSDDEHDFGLGSGTDNEYEHATEVVSPCV